MNELIIDGLLADLLLNVGSGALFAGGGWVWYHFGPRRDEAKWIESYGVLFYIYYRNVDWRCDKIARQIGAESSAAPLDRDWLARELIKLKADLAGLEKLTELWADRVSAFPLWYPYSKRVRELLSAASLLSASLHRHIDPLLWHFESSLGSAKPDDERAYACYFTGAPERFWKGNVDSKGCAAIGKLCEEGHLHQRLQATLLPLLTLLREEAECHPDQLQKALPGWDQHRSPSEVWFLDQPRPWCPESEG
jgi:hypothetical protein